MITKLKIELVRSGLMQYEVAGRMGIADSLLSLYASGRREIPKHHLRALARILNVAQKDLVGQA